MMNLQASLRTRLALGQDLAALADELDREIDASTPGPVYATLFIGIFDPVSRQLQYVNAGHNPQYVLRAGHRLEPLAATGLPIGLISGYGYVHQTVQLNAGDQLFFYTDGCVEAENQGDDMFGVERLEALLADAAASGDILAHVEHAITRFRNGRDLSDDATMMVVSVG
jgi:sigma-B regulation protein RsbU (phosphoserine phosphatase)